MYVLCVYICIYLNDAAVNLILDYNTNLLFQLYSTLIFSSKWKLDLAVVSTCACSFIKL